MTIQNCMLSAGPLERIGVDFENNIIHGIVAAEAGEFKTQKGAFDDEQLAKIVDLINENPKGNVSYLGHPRGGNDVDRPYLGTFRNARKEGARVRVDLHLSKVAMRPQPNSNTERSWGQYVMELAEEDPRALGFSIRPSVKILPRNGKKPIWDVQAIKGGDIVREGDATNSFLSTDDSHSGTVDLSDDNSPEPEDRKLSLDSETKSFIKDTVTDAVSAALAAQAEKAEELAAKRKADEERQELEKKVRDAELATEAANFKVKATSLGMEAKDVDSISGQVKDGKLSAADASGQLIEFMAKKKDGQLDDSGAGGDDQKLSAEDQAIKVEYDKAQDMGLAVGTFEEFKKLSADNTVDIS